MPATIGGFELFALPCSRESTEDVEYATFRNPIGHDGFRSKKRYGADTGRRDFFIPHDGLAGGGNAATITVNGAAMNQATYIRDLFRRKEDDGTPFVIQSLENNQYYLVEFAESKQTLTKKLAARYATQINLTQVRIPNVSVFQMSQVPYVWGRYKGDNFPEIGLGVFQAQDLSGNNRPLTPNGNIDNSGAMKAGKKTFKFNVGGTNNGFLNTTLDPTIYEAFFVIKINEASFSNFAGIWASDIAAGSGGLAALVGNQASTKFYDFTFGSGYEFRTNGILKAEDDQQAPMNEWAVLHWRRDVGITLNNMQVGKDRAYTDRYGEMEIGEMVFLSGLNPLSYSKEISEHLQTDWQI